MIDLPEPPDSEDPFFTRPVPQPVEEVLEVLVPALPEPIDCDASSYQAAFNPPPKPIVDHIDGTVALTPAAGDTFHVMPPDEERGQILSLARALLANGPFSFSDLASFKGDGIYAISYHGDLPVYEAVKSKTCKLYIGKAEREEDDASLYIRLCEHVKTLTMVTNLSLSDFTFHFLVLPLERVSYAEANLIRLYRPAWNTYLKGFGLRAKDRNGTHRDEGWATRVSLFNTYHPGRELAAKAVPRDHDEVEKGLREAVRISRERYDVVQVYITS